MSEVYLNFWKNILQVYSIEQVQYVSHKRKKKTTAICFMMDRTLLILLYVIFFCFSMSFVKRAKNGLVSNKIRDVNISRRGGVGSEFNLEVSRFL